MSIEKTIADLQAAMEDNAAAIRELREVLLRAGEPKSFREVITPPKSEADGKTPSPAESKTASPAAEIGAVTYKELSERFLGLIKLVGTAAEAKKLVLEPLGLVDLRSNQEKPELFPAIMEKIKAAEATHKAAV